MFCVCGCGLPVAYGREFRRGHASGYAARLRKEAKQGNLNAYNELERRGWVRERTLGNKFGIELEFFGIHREDAVTYLKREGLSAADDGYHHEPRPYWRVTEDGSVHGEANELVSPILRLPTIPSKDAVGKATKALSSNGGIVDRSCGYHVHHNAKRLGGWRVYTAVTSYNIWQPKIDELLPASRHGHQEYQGPNNLEDWSKLPDYYPLRNMSSLEVWRSIKEERYTNVNAEALNVHGTLEFRQHSGTLNSTKVWNWARFTKLFTQVKADPIQTTVKKYGSLEAFTAETTFGDMLTYLKAPPDLVDWANSRRKALSESTDEEDRASNSRLYTRQEYDESINEAGEIGCAEARRRDDPPDPGDVCCYCERRCMEDY